MNMNTVALVVGSSGISGYALSKELVNQGFDTYGLSRGSAKDAPGVKSLHADLLNTAELERVLSDLRPSHVFFTTWMRKDSEQENIQVNSMMVRNLLQVLSIHKSVKHVGLVTGLKHYLGPFDAYVKSGVPPLTPLREDQPRLDMPNFYYAQEDEVYKAAQRDNFTWAIHRPHTLIGNSVGNQMNMGTTLAVYASICKQQNLPFIFPGSKAQWDGLSDVTDAKMLAKQIIWAATTPEASNNAYNIVNGDLFRWSWLWNQIAQRFGIEAVGFQGEIKPLEQTLAGKEEIWKAIAKKYDLKVDDLHKASSAWHTDLDLSRPIEVNTDMTRSRKLGFKEYRSTLDSFFELFDELQAEKIIPSF